MQKKDPNAVTEADRFTTKTSFSESQSRQSKIPKKISKKSRYQKDDKQRESRQQLNKNGKQKDTEST